MRFGRGSLLLFRPLLRRRRPFSGEFAFVVLGSPSSGCNGFIILASPSILRQRHSLIEGQHAVVKTFDQAHRIGIGERTGTAKWKEFL